MKVQLLTILLALYKTFQTCPTLLEIPSTNCQIRVQYKNKNNCSSQIIASRCFWRICLNTDCSTYSISTTQDWKICTSVCCSSVHNYPLNFEGMQLCRSSNNLSGRLLKQTSSSQDSNRGIYTGVFVCILLGIGLFCLCFCCYRHRMNLSQCIRDRCSCLFCCQKCLRGDNINNSSRRRLKRARIKSFISIGKKWTLDQKARQKVREICTICLQDHPSLQLACGHLFHKKCIIMSMKRKRECVNCRQTHFDPVKVYCETCTASYFETTLMQHILVLQREHQVCEGCKVNVLLSQQRIIDEVI